MPPAFPSTLVCVTISTLPPEILSIIVQHLYNPHEHDRRTTHPSTRLKLATYATVCRQWQPLIEAYTFRKLKLDLGKSPSELADFQTIFARHRVRRDALAQLSVEPVLPDYSVRSRHRYERGSNCQANNVAFTDAIRGLFDIIQSWEAMDASDRRRPLFLQILSPYAPMDRYQHPDGVDPLNYGMGGIGRGNRYLHSYLRLLGLDMGPDPLPVVRRIIKLRITNAYRCRQTEPSSAVAIASHLPSLEHLDLELGADNEWRYPVMRRQHRLDFAHALTSLTLSAPPMHSFSLSYGMTTPLDHNYPIPSALHPSSPTDELSVA